MTAALESARDFPYAAAGITRRDRGPDTPSLGGMNEIDTLMREAARYLAAVDTFRGLGHEPRWRPEVSSWSWDDEDDRVRELETPLRLEDLR